MTASGIASERDARLQRMVALQEEIDWLVYRAFGLWDGAAGDGVPQRAAEALTGEAPSAYKDIGAVMRAQRELTRVVRKLRPVLSFKAAY